MAPATRRPGTSFTSGPRTGSAPRASSTASGSESRFRRWRHLATATLRSRRSESENTALTYPSAGVSPTVPSPCGSRRLLRYTPSSNASTPGTARTARKLSSGPAANGRRWASRNTSSGRPLAE